VTADNLGKTPGTFVPSGRTGRVSIYTRANGVAFLAAPVQPDADYVDAITALRDALDIREVHLTGGEIGDQYVRASRDEISRLFLGQPSLDLPGQEQAGPRPARALAQQRRDLRPARPGLRTGPRQAGQGIRAA